MVAFKDRASSLIHTVRSNDVAGTRPGGCRYTSLRLQVHVSVAGGGADAATARAAGQGWEILSLGRFHQQAIWRCKPFKGILIKAFPEPTETNVLLKTH